MSKPLEIKYSVSLKKESRIAIYERDGGRCRYCNVVLDEDEYDIDHVIPQHGGGLTIEENVVLACRPCNHRKHTQVWAPRPLDGSPWIRTDQQVRSDYRVFLMEQGEKIGHVVDLSGWSKTKYRKTICYIMCSCKETNGWIATYYPVADRWRQDHLESQLGVLADTYVDLGGLSREDLSAIVHKDYQVAKNPW